MRDIMATILPESLVAVEGGAGFAQEHNAARILVELNDELGAEDISYHCFCFDSYGLGRKIVSNNIYGLESDSPATRNGNTLICPLPEALTSTGELTVQIEAHMAVDGEAERIVKSGMFTLRFEPSITGQSSELEESCGLLPRLQAVLAGIEAVKSDVVLCSPAEFSALATKNPRMFYLVDGEEEPAEEIQVTGVTLNKSTAAIFTGSMETLAATITPVNAANTGIVWSSSDAAVATVSQMGLVTGITEGTSSITVTTIDGGFTAVCAVTVSAAVQSVAVTGIMLNNATMSLISGATETLTATVAPANASNIAVVWSSGNSVAATVNQAGVVTAISAGIATITATTADSGFTATCTVNVSAAAGLWQGTKTANGISVTISGSHITINGTKTTANSSLGSGYLTDNAVTLFAAPTAWHTFAAGTQLTMTVSNVSGSASCNAANAACALRKTDNTTLAGSAWGTPAGTFTYTCAVSAPVYGLMFYMQTGETAANFGFDLAFWVDGVRWL